MQATLTGQHACTQLLLLLIWTSRGLHHPYPLPLLQAQTGGPVSYIPANCCCRDFQLRNVASINASGHKFGLVYPGLGWVLWRNSSLLPDSLVFHVSNTMCRIAMSARCCCYCCCLCSSGWAILHLPSCPPPCSPRGVSLEGLVILVFHVGCIRLVQNTPAQVFLYRVGYCRDPHLQGLWLPKCTKTDLNTSIESMVHCG
jgi:hypothetical protein